ncbi:MAG: acetyl-CoA carboxylase biotin carboxyl carrier protein [Thermoanaerobaculia bacterium]
MLNFEQIKDLIELVAARRLGGLEIERSGFRLRIEGGGRSASAHAAAELRPADESQPVVAARSAEPAASPPVLASAEAASGKEPAAPATEDELPAGAQVIKSPFVGTFYRARNPKAKPFVEVGARIEKGQVICIVEAMKLMNEIEVEVAGVVLQVYPQNEQMVEYGTKLFAIQPT